MKNNLFQKIILKNKESLELINNLEHEIISLSKEMAKRIISNKGRIIFVGVGMSSEICELATRELWYHFRITENQFKIITVDEKTVSSVDSWKELEELPPAAIWEAEKTQINKNDLIIGVSYSGETPFVNSVLTLSMEKGATLALITNIAHTNDKDYAFNICLNDSDEIILGYDSGVGNQQKTILDLLIMSAMENAGRIWKESLVLLQPLNKKLYLLCIKIISEILSIDKKEAKNIFEKYDRNLEISLITTLKGISIESAKDLIIKNNFNIAKIIDK